MKPRKFPRAGAFGADGNGRCDVHGTSDKGRISMGDVITAGGAQGGAGRHGRGTRARLRASSSCSTSCCPFSYLAAERVDRVFDDVVWTPASDVGAAAAARWRRSGGAGRRTEAGAERRAAELRLPLDLARALPRARCRPRCARRTTRPSRAAARRSCSPRAGSRSAAASTSTTPRSWPRRPRRRASAWTAGCSARARGAPRRRDRGGRAPPAGRGRRPAARAARRARAVLGRGSRRRRGRGRGARTQAAARCAPAALRA